MSVTDELLGIGGGAPSSQRQAIVLLRYLLGVLTGVLGTVVVVSAAAGAWASRVDSTLATVVDGLAAVEAAVEAQPRPWVRNELARLAAEIDRLRAKHDGGRE